MDVRLTLLPHQKRVFLSDRMFAGICGGRGSGKSYMLSALAAMSLCQGQRILVLAQNYRSLADNIFAEINSRLLEWGLSPKFNLNTMKITVPGSDGVVFGMSYENLDAVRGYTCISLAILDEAALAPSNLLEVLSPCLRGEGIVPRIRFGSTPRGMSWFNRMLKDKTGDPDWDIATATTFDNKMLSKESIDLIQGSFRDEAMRRQELYGEILDGEVSDCILPSVYNFDNHASQPVGECVCGMDFARFGNDATVITVRDNDRLLHVSRLEKADSYAIYDEWKRLDSRFNFIATVCDGTGGFSGGFADTARRSGYRNIYELNFGGAPLADRTCANSRTEIYFRLAAAMREGFYVGDSDALDELRATGYTINNSGKKALLPKDKVKEVIGHSPDSADALALAFADYTRMDNGAPISRTTEKRLIGTMFR